MEFYYKGVKVRTSKTHTYKFGVRHEFKGNVFWHGCSATYEGAKKTMQREQSNNKQNLEYITKKLYGNTPLRRNETREELLSTKEYYEEWLKPESWEIVELEQR